MHCPRQHNSALTSAPAVHMLGVVVARIVHPPAPAEKFIRLTIAEYTTVHVQCTVTTTYGHHFSTVGAHAKWPVRCRDGDRYPQPH